MRSGETDMNSSRTALGPNQAELFCGPEKPPGVLIFRMDLDCLPRRKKGSKPQKPDERHANPVVPSWNDVLGMEQWARYQFKAALARRFLSALRASAADSSTKTICVRSTLSTCCATLASYLQTQREKRESNRARKKSEAKIQSLFESKSTNSEQLPF